MEVFWIIKNLIIIIVFLYSSRHDYLCHEVPNIYPVILMVIGTIDRLIRIEEIGKVLTILVLPIIFIMVVYSLIYFILSGGIGGGDIKLLMGLGICIGFWESIRCFAIAAVIFIIVRLIETLRFKKSISETHPFSPYLLAAYIAKICIYQIVV